MIQCTKHPKYKGLKKPKVACEGCWAVYFGICVTCINCGCQQAEIEQ